MKNSVKKINKRIITLVLMFSMVLSNLVYLKDVSFADNNSGKTPSITLEKIKSTPLNYI